MKRPSLSLQSDTASSEYHLILITLFHLQLNTEMYFVQYNSQQLHEKKAFINKACDFL